MCYKHRQRQNEKKQNPKDHASAGCQFTHNALGNDITISHCCHGDDCPIKSIQNTANHMSVFFGIKEKAGEKDDGHKHTKH